MIFNTIIKGKGGITGEPIDVAELPTPSANTVGKVYAVDTKVTPEVGQVVGDKLYFDTSKNPLDYSLGSAIVMGATESGIHCTYVDFFALQGITGMGHCYAIGVATPDMSVFLGIAYIYCDVLTVDQFNTNVGASLGLPAISAFGWQTDVVDITSIKDRKITYVNEKYDFVKVKGKDYYIGITDNSFRMNEPVGDKIYFDTTKNPVDYVAYMDKSLIGISNGTNTYFLAMVDVLAAQGVTGYGHCYGLALATQDMSTILGIAYIYCDVLNVAQFNQMIGSQFGLTITEFEWQTNVLDISAVADYKVIYNYLADWDFLAYGNNWYEIKKAHIDEINKLMDENETLTTEKSSLETQVSALQEQVDVLEDKEYALRTGYLGENFLITENINRDCLYAGSSGSVVINEGVRRISRGAFYNSYITNISLPNSLTSIGDSAFAGCHILKTITIPAGIIELPYKFLYGGNDLTDSGLSMQLESVLFADNSQLEKIDGYAFYNCSSLTNITIPDSVTSIGRYAFYNCSSLTSINIPNGVTEIDKYVFYNCSSLTNITIPNGVTFIGEHAFSGCSSLTSINIPNGVTEIDNKAFSYCMNLTTIDIPNSVEIISSEAFAYCTNLTSIKLPENLNRINESTFIGCDSLTTIDIPDGVKFIEDYAFNSCDSLTSINIPASVVKIGAYAFGYCKNLTSIIFNSTIPPSMGYALFYECNSITTIRVPDYRVDEYKEVLKRTDYSLESKVVGMSDCTVTVNYTVDGNDHGVMGDTAPETVAYASEFNFQVDCEQGYEVDANNITVTGATLASTRTVYEPDGVTVIPESLLLYFTDVTGDVTINVPLRQY